MRAPGWTATSPQDLTHRPRASGPHDLFVRARPRWDFECWRVLTPEAMRRRCRHRVVGTKAIAHSRSRPAMPIAPDAVASIAAQPAVRDDRDPPLVSGQDVLSVRSIRNSVKWNILRGGLDRRCGGSGRGCFARRDGEARVTAFAQRARAERRQLPRAERKSFGAVIIDRL
jgi:hypothetical protein